MSFIWFSTALPGLFTTTIVNLEDGTIGVQIKHDQIVWLITQQNGVALSDLDLDLFTINTSIMLFCRSCIQLYSVIVDCQHLTKAS